MSAHDFILSKEHRRSIVDTLPLGVSAVDALLAAQVIQDELRIRTECDARIKEARTEGIREVWEFIKDTGYSQRIYHGNTDGEFPEVFEVQFGWEKLQAKLKEWGVPNEH